MPFQNAIGFFTSLGVQSVIYDVDGNIYTFVTIGTQQWLVENLKTTKYRDGTPIPNVTVDATWAADITGAYCWYNNDIANKTPYGALYNWYAVNNAHVLAPTGWRVPSNADWATLIAFLGGSAVAGGKLKEQGLAHWDNPNTDATDDYGFKALGNGYRSSAGVFTEWGTAVIFGGSSSSGGFSTQGACYFDRADFDYSTMGSFIPGKSIRCMRDI